VSSIQILDASAALAYLQQEKGKDRVGAALEEGPCWMTTVNTCEVLGRLCDRGMPPQEAQTTVDELRLVVKVFDEELAALAAFLRVPTRSIGASLGDRACLALAEQTARTQDTPIVYTTETAWTRIKWPFKVVVIR
jgi:PIN domain nuclease of toxin-antitoxin system